VDIVAADEFAADSPSETVAADQIASDKVGLDIGPESVNRLSALCRTRKPSSGTGRWAWSVAAGRAAVRVLSLQENGFAHISAGGGASLEYLEQFQSLKGMEVAAGR
jgi:phosphoglycerate kinase